MRPKLLLIAAGWASLIAASAVAVALSMILGGGGTDTQAPTHVLKATQEQTELLTSLRARGLLNDQPSADDESQSSGAAHGERDRGPGPTFTQLEALPDDQLLALFPAGAMTATDLPRFKTEIEELRAFVSRIHSTEDAQAAGYFQATNDVPYMGEHWINGEYLGDGVFDPRKPEGLLFSTVDGVHQVVGVWFLQLPGMGSNTQDVAPQGFAGAFDEWHAHVGLCVVGTEAAQEGVSSDECAARGGDYTGDLRWMLHVWVAPEAAENSRSVVAYLNAELNEKQLATKAAARP